MPRGPFTITIAIAAALLARATAASAQSDAPVAPAATLLEPVVVAAPPSTPDARHAGRLIFHVEGGILAHGADTSISAGAAHGLAAGVLPVIGTGAAYRRRFWSIGLDVAHVETSASGQSMTAWFVTPAIDLHGAAGPLHLEGGLGMSFMIFDAAYRASFGTGVGSFTEVDESGFISLVHGIAVVALPITHFLDLFVRAEGFVPLGTAPLGGVIGMVTGGLQLRLLP